jgi:probable rRNA maturation factor
LLCTTEGCQHEPSCLFYPLLSLVRMRDRRLIILDKKVAGLSEQSLRRFTGKARFAVGLRGRVDVLITSDARMRSLNAKFRQKNKPTDVLSFPTPVNGGSSTRESIAGELAISADIAAQNAVLLGHPPASEVKLLVLHGLLHLAGYNHERDNGRMARKEARLRRELRLPVGLIERSLSGHPAASAPEIRRPLSKVRRSG